MKDNGTLLHEWFNALPRYSFSFDKAEVSENGVYVLFENGEKYGSLDRVVHVGTHTGQDNLVKRLGEHFLVANKDRSIFRKNIGRAILARDHQLDLLKEWNLDLTTKKAREAWSGKLDIAALEALEQQVTTYIQDNFTFAVVPIESKTGRLFFKEAIIATVQQSLRFHPSDNWLGKFSPQEKICRSGLWQVQGLNGCPLSDGDMQDLQKYIEL